MATVRWLGLRGAIRKVYRWTVNASSGDTYTLTHNLKVISYTAGASDTTSDVAAGLVAAAAASPEPEWQEVEVSASGAVVSVTGPVDGATFTVTASVSGSATMSAGTTTSPVSAHDVGDGANYSSGSLPANNDTLVIPAGSADLRYNLEALASVTGLTIIREAGGPSIGLPDYRADGYLEYRPTRLKTPATTVKIAFGDDASTIRLNLHSATSAITITGQQVGGNAIGAEAVDIIGAASTSSIKVSGSSVVVAPGYLDTATLASIIGDNATVRVGRGVTLTSAEVFNCTTQIDCNWTALTVTGGTTTVTGTATGGLTVDQGTVDWQSSGTLTNPVIGANATLLMTGGSAAVAVSGTITRYDGSSIIDPSGRLTKPYDVDNVRCGLDGLDLGRNVKITVDAI